MEEEESTLLPSVGILALSHSENAALRTGHRDDRMSDCETQALNLLCLLFFLTFKKGKVVVPSE